MSGYPGPFAVFPNRESVARYWQGRVILGEHNWNCLDYKGGDAEGGTIMNGNSQAICSKPEPSKIIGHRNSKLGILDNHGPYPLPPCASLDTTIAIYPTPKVIDGVACGIAFGRWLNFNVMWTARLAVLAWRESIPFGAPGRAALVLLLAVFGSVPVAVAGDKVVLPEFTLRSWDSEDGMPLAEARALARTPDGYLWIGTSVGLARFDGARFVVMTTNNTPALGDNRISSLLVDAAGDLWVGTAGGTLARQCGRGFEAVDVSPQLRGQAITSLAQSGEGAVWLGTRNLGLARLSGKHSPVRDAGASVTGTLGAFIPTFFNTNNGLPGNWVSRIVADGRGKPWAVAGGVLLTFGPDGWKIPAAARELPPVRALAPARDGGLWVATTVKEDYGARVFKLAGDGVLSEAGDYPWRQDALRSMIDVLWEDAAGRLWAGSFGGGVYSRRGGDGWQRLTVEGLLSQNIVTGMAESGPGALWVTLESGQLVQVQERLVNTLRLPPPHDEVAVKAACASRDGSLWIGTEGAGVFRVRDGVTTRFGEEQGLGSGKIGVIFEDRRTNLWVGTWAGLYRFDGQRFEYAFPTKQNEGVVLSLFEDSRDNLWVGTVFNILCLRDGQRVKEYSPLKSSSPGYSQYQEINSFAEDHAGRLWVTVGLNGLFRLEGDEFQRVGGGQWAGERSVKRVYCDSQGMLWITTWGDGLFRLREGEFRQWTARDGLPSDTLQALIEDDAGRLWIGSINGIFGCSPRALEGYERGKSPPLVGWSLSVAEGLEDRFCSGVGNPILVRLDDGRIGFPNQRVLALFDPEPVVRTRTRPLSLMFEEVLVDGVRQTLGAGAEGLRMRSDARQLEINYTVPDFQTPRRLRFFYKLEGYDPDWVDAGSRRVAYYRQLAPGRYEFQLLTSSMENDGKENIARLHVEVVPTFWERREVRITAGVALVAALVAGVILRERSRAQRRIEQLEARRTIEIERRRIAQDIHDDLGASLTRIAWLGDLTQADQASPARVSDHAARITEYARRMSRSMDEIVWAVNPRNDTFQSLLQYITHYADETFGSTAVNCRLDLPTDAPATELSAETRHDIFLMLKESLSNILKHARATETRIGIQVDGPRLRLAIEDDGCGFAPDVESARRQGNGLANLRERVARLGGDFQCKSTPGRGTKLVFNIPLRHLPESRA